MANCDRCGEKLKRNAKFCSSCGDEITWPERINLDNIEENADKFTNFLKDKGNEILEDNLPEEYIDKVKDNISNFNEISQNPETLNNARENIQNASESVKEYNIAPKSRIKYSLLYRFLLDKNLSINLILELASSKVSV